jgi:hypothetical protein
VADAYTDEFAYEGYKLHSESNPALCPGRGMGVGDVPGLKLVGDIDPGDVNQGAVAVQGC